MFKAMLVGSALGCSLMGCSVGPEMTVGGLGVQGASNELYQDGEIWAYRSQGSDPTGVNLDAEGVDVLGSGPQDISGFNLPVINGDGESVDEMLVFLVGQGEESIGELMIYNPYSGDLMLHLKDYSKDNTVGIDKYNARVIATLEAQGVITEAEKEVAIKALDATTNVFEALAEAGVRAFVPTP